VSLKEGSQIGDAQKLLPLLIHIDQLQLASSALAARMQ
jgi:hypothetical protein